MNFIIFLVLLVPACVYAEYDCKHVPKCFLKPINKEGILNSEKDVRDTCSQYDAYIKCVEEFGKQCWGSDYENKYNLATVGVSGIKKICTEDNYRTEYVKEVESFAKIQTDFKICVLVFQLKGLKAIISKDESKKSKDLCCAAKAFENCSNNLCVGKCTPEATKILKEIIAIHESEPAIRCSVEDRNRWTNCP